MSHIKVDFAVYGALKDGNEINGRAINVKSKLQQLINQNNGVVTISNAYLGESSCHGSVKSFGAQIRREGLVYHFSCQEGQIINFEQGGHAIL